MPQAGIDPLRQCHPTYEASALPPSHHSWILKKTLKKKEQNGNHEKTLLVSPRTNARPEG